ncbi:MAG: transcription termination/antitermination protein NusG, partial [Candidatus Fonsibacter sp.]
MANDDAFEAALTAGDTRAESVDSAATDLGGQVAVDVDTQVASEIETSESIENDENAEFRNSLRNAPGEWFVVHSY